MLENLKEVVLDLEKSLKALVQDEEVELLKHPEYLQAMKEVVQSINQVVRTLKNLERSQDKESEQSKKKQTEMKKTSGSGKRILKAVPKKNKDHRASSK